MSLIDPISGAFLSIARSHPHEITGNLKYNATKQKSVGNKEIDIVFDLNDAYYIKFVQRRSDFIGNVFLALCSYTENALNSKDGNKGFVENLVEVDNNKLLKRQLANQESLNFAQNHTSSWDRKNGKVIYNVLSK